MPKETTHMGTFEQGALLLIFVNVTIQPLVNSMSERKNSKD